MFRWKTENSCLKNFFRVMGQKLALREIEESQGFPEVKHSKYQNGFFLITSSRLLEPIATYRIEFGWVELILWSFENSPVTGSRGGEESQEDSLKITTCEIIHESLSVQIGKIWTWYHILMCFIIAWTVKFDEHGPDNLKSMHGRWNFVKNSKKLTWVHMKYFHF